MYIKALPCFLTYFYFAEEYSETLNIFRLFMSDFSSAPLQNIKIKMLTWTIESVCVRDYDSK